MKKTNTTTTTAAKCAAILNQADATRAAWKNNELRDYSKLAEAQAVIMAANDVYSFDEFVREYGNSDYALEDAEMLDELAEGGGDWAKPSHILARAFYGHRFNPWGCDPANASKEVFNPNDDYVAFDGYANLVSVQECDRAWYWCFHVSFDEYCEKAEELGLIDDLADAIGVETKDEEGGAE